MSEIAKRIPFIAISQLVIPVGIWQGWEFVQKKPIAATICALLYECGILLLAFGHKVWTELEKDIVAATARWIRNAVRGFSPGFSRRYKKQVVYDHGIFNVRGLGMLNTYSLKLEQVFVDLRIDASNPQKFNLDPIARKDFAGNRPIWDFLRPDSEEARMRALAIIGAPGCGKTTLLQHVALTFAVGKHHLYKIQSYIPILLFLRDHVALITQQKPSLEKLVQNYFSNPDLFPTLQPPPNWFQRQLERGKCMVLLDGLDEIADEKERKLVSRWVDDQIRSYPRSYFLLTARPQGYKNAPLFNAHILEVQPFNAGQVQRFVHNWFLANEIMSSNSDDVGVRQKAQRDAKDLLDRLRIKSSLHDLTANPLLLTMITMVHRYRGALPGSRVELYSEICEVLLGRWRQTKGVHDTLRAAQKLMILRPLAAHMMARKERDIRTANALKVITPLLKIVNVKGITPQDFLSELQASSGLLLEREADLWSFAHLTFQEYLTATHWLEQKKADIKWKDLVVDSWWSETLRLYAAQGDATELVQACLEVNSAESLTLAAECLEEARAIDPKVSLLAEERLIGGIESNTESNRRLATEVQLSRRLKKLQRVENQRSDELCEIDLEYITCAEYQLFLNELWAQDIYRQPDHWSSFSFDTGKAFTPVCGIRPSDAVAFCEWLTKRQGGGARYRLPSSNEAIKYPARESNLAAWCTGQATPTLVGATPRFEEQINQQINKLLGIAKPTRLFQFSDTNDTGSFFLILNDIETVLNTTNDTNFVRTIIRALEEYFTIDLDNYDPLQLIRLFGLLLGRTLDYTPEKRDMGRSQKTSSELTTRLADSFSHCSSLSSTLNLACQFGYAVIRFGEESNTQNFMHELALVINVSRKLSDSLSDAFSFVSNLDPEFKGAAAIDINLAQALTRAFSISTFIGNTLEQLNVAIEQKNTGKVKRLTEDFFSRTECLRNEGLILVSEILTAAKAETLSESQQTHRQFLSRILTYVFSRDAQANNQGPYHVPFTRKILVASSNRQKSSDSAEITALKLYGWLKIILAREERKLDVWEGIRIVRERE